MQAAEEIFCGYLQKVNGQAVSTLSPSPLINETINGHIEMIR